MEQKNAIGQKQKRMYDERIGDLGGRLKYIEEKIKKLLQGEIKTGQRVLDVGCGDCRVINLYKPLGAEYYGVDISVKKAEAKKKGLRVKQHDITQGLPYAKAYFDAVHCSEVIEHIFDTDHLVSEMSRVLKPGGFLILTTPNVAALNSRLRMILGHRPTAIEYRVGPGNAGHIRAFVWHELKALLEEHGFKVERVLGQELWIWPGLNMDGWIGRQLRKWANHLPTLSSGFVVKARRVK